MNKLEERRHEREDTGHPKKLKEPSGTMPPLKLLLCGSLIQNGISWLPIIFHEEGLFIPFSQTAILPIHL